MFYAWRLIEKGIFNTALSLVSPKGGDVEGKKTAFTQNVFNIPLGEQIADQVERVHNHVAGCV